MFSRRRALADTRVLWLSNETPDVGGQGGQRRQYFQIRELVRKGIVVEVMTIAGPQDDDSLRALTPVTRIRRVFPGGLRNPVHWKSAERAARSGRYSHVVVAHLESWSLLGKSPESISSRILVDVHNVFSSWLSLLGEIESARHFAHLEREVVHVADAVAVCSGAELRRLPHGGSATRLIVPHGIDPAEWKIQPRRPTAQRIAMFGSWSWHPNRLGLQWFLSEVWPDVLDRVPGATVHIAGSVSNSDIVGHNGVVIRGRVPDLPTFTRKSRAVVVPVLDGVGASVKFGESLASGRPVLATVDAGSAHPESPAVVSDDPNIWVQKLEQWLLDQDEADQEGIRIGDFAQNELSWAGTAAPLVNWISRTDRVAKAGD